MQYVPARLTYPADNATQGTNAAGRNLHQTSLNLSDSTSRDFVGPTNRIAKCMLRLTQPVGKARKNGVAKFFLHVPTEVRNVDCREGVL
jgi:hypothetical protein